ncbi:MAG: WYL domain-containing protein [Oscillospiraceae bacterium]|nr:WYL domain-containing protein [Oscillospiraceae bacterium]
MAYEQKLKLLYLRELLLRESDEQHPLTMKQLLAGLEARGVKAERKSVYDDIQALSLSGLDVISVGQGRQTAYFVGQRSFELPELKLLVDSVQSSKFLTHNKTSRLIRKIETLASIHEAQLLQRQVYVTNRVKQMNESIYINVDKLHDGISRDRKIRFKYFTFTVDKRKEYRHGGAFYLVSPYALTWDDENYYLVAYDDETREIRHYRVDKMDSIRVTDAPRDGQEAFRALDMGSYARKVFGMFRGEELNVRLRFDNELAGAVLDRLGADCILVPDGPEHFTVTATVVVSPLFFAWVSGFGAQARIIAPASVVAQMRAHAEAVAGMYRN